MSVVVAVVVGVVTMVFQDNSVFIVSIERFGSVMGNAAGGTPSAESDCLNPDFSS